MPKYGSQIDTQRIPIKGLMAEPAITGSAPATPPEGLFWHDTTLKVIKVWLDAQWKTLGEAGAGGPPSGSAGGDLAGSTYPNPTIAAGVVTDTKVAAANKDGAVGTASMRTLGTGALQAAAGNHTHVAPSNVSDGDKGEITVTGGNWTIDNLVVTAAKIANATITDTQVAAANKDGAVGTASMRTLGTGATQAAAGNDARFTDSRAPSGSAGGDLTGSTYPNPVIAALAVTDGKVAAANKDGADATPSMRTLGYTAGKAMPGVARLDQIALPTTFVSMNNQRISSLATPNTADHAANKGYVDSVAQGLGIKGSVRVASVANVTATYNATGGTSGRGQFTAAPNTLDGVSLAANNRILLKNMTTGAQNGVFVVSTLGTGANGVWDRATDFDEDAEVRAGAFVFVEEGTQADTGWVMTTNNPIIIGGASGTALVWTQFSGAGGVTPGAGLILNGSAFDVGQGAGITVNADTIQVANDGITNAMLADGAVNLAGNDVTGTLPITKGGTGGATAPLARTSLGAAGIVHVSVPALSAGAWVTITGVGKHAVARFIEVASPFQEVILDQRENAGELQIKADIAYSAGALYATYVT